MAKDLRYKVLKFGHMYRIYDYKEYTIIKNDDGSYYGIDGSNESFFQEVKREVEMFCNKLNNQETQNE